MLKINPGHSKVWLSQDQVQIGLEADAVTVGGLSPAHQRLLQSLERGISENQLSTIAKSLKLEADSANSLIERLKPVMLESEKPSTLSTKTAQRFPFAQQNPDFAEIIRFGLRHNIAGEQGLQHRSSRIVHLDSLSRVGLTTIRGLASAGVTQFWCADRNSVDATDTTALGYPKELIGWSRFLAADTVANSFQHPVALVDSGQLRSRVFDRVDLAIVICRQLPDPRIAKLWWRRGVPHLAITFDASGTRISPVVVPGKTPCLVCRDHQLASQDDMHLVKLHQLTSNKTPYDDASSVLFAAAAATTISLAQLDSSSGFEMADHEQAGVWFERKSGLVHRVHWQMDSPCRCYEADEDQDSEADGRLDFSDSETVNPAA